MLHNVRLTSTPMVNTAGMFQWAQAHYKSDREYVTNVISKGYNLSVKVTDQLLSGKIEHVVVGEEIHFSVEGDYKLK
jgi:hypothetical protein